MSRQGAQAAWCLDEGRFGLKVWFRRRWCAYGERPEWIYQDKYQWLWVYVALESLTGDSFCLFLPRVDSACLQIFADRFGDYVASKRVGLVMDSSGAHRSTSVVWPAQVLTVSLPPYSPQLNPVELVFRHLRAALSNRVFEHLEELESAITQVLQHFWQQPGALRSLTGYPWWLQAAPPITPSVA